MIVNTYNSSYRSLTKYYLDKTLSNTRVNWDAFKSKRIKEVELGVLGCYHQLNVGDMALGLSIQRIAESQGVSSQLKSIHCNDYLKYANTRSIILGGGSITLPENFEKLKKLVSLSKRVDTKIAIVGVDLNTQYFSDEILKLLREVNFISYRCFYGDERSELSLPKILGRNDTVSHPDLAFSLYPNIQQVATEPIDCKNRPKILGISIFPWYFSLNKGKWIGKDYSSNYFGISSLERPDYVRLGSDYINLVVAIINHYQKLGYVVHHIPFAPEDDLFAKTMFGNLNIVFNDYTPKPTDVLKKIGKLSLFVGTRLHANIFALIQRVPLISIAYGMKCENLFADLEIHRSNQITHEDFVNNKGNYNFFLDVDPVVLSSEKLQQLASDVKVSVKKAISLLRE